MSQDEITIRTIKEMEEKLGCPLMWHDLDGSLNKWVIITHLCLVLSYEEDYWTNPEYFEIEKALGGR